MKRRPLLAVVVVLTLALAACGRSGTDEAAPQTSTGSSNTTAARSAKCEGQQLEASDTGVTADSITVTVMADTGSPLAPGLFQGNVDGVKGFEKWVNDNGGIGCRKLVVQTWDSRLDPTESKNGLLEACRTSLAMVGNNALFNPDMTPLTTCPDKAGAMTPVPDLAALTADPNEMCMPGTFPVQAVTETCPIATGVRPITAGLGYFSWLDQQFPDAKALFMVPGDLPTTVQASTPIIAAMEQAGIEVADAVKVGGRDEQSAFTPKVQLVKSSGANLVYDGSNDVAMVKMRKEAASQGLTTVDAWTCSLACYTDNFKAEGAAVDGTYVAMQFLPFEEKDQNEELARFMDNVPKADAWAAQSWQAALLFKQVVDQIVEAQGPNAITRANVLQALQGIDTFDANGWMGAKPLRGMSDCYVILQLKSGTWERVFPEEKGTFDCAPESITTLQMDPAAAAAEVR